jgi:hypothetical protein
VQNDVIAISTTRLGVPARLLAAIGTPFVGRTVSTDRRAASLKGRGPSALGSTAGVNFVPNTIPHRNP